MWCATTIPLQRRLPGASSNPPGRQDLDIDPEQRAGSRHWPTPSLFGLAPGGVYHAASVAAGAVRSYRTFSPLPRRDATCRGGLFSVALSLGLPPPDVIRHRMSVEPGLSSPATFRPLPERPSGRLTEDEWGARPFPSRPLPRDRRGPGQPCATTSSPKKEPRGKPFCILRSSSPRCPVHLPSIGDSKNRTIYGLIC